MTLPPLLLLLVIAARQDPATQGPATPGPVLDDATCVQDAAACVKVAGAEFDAGHFAAAVRLFEALAAAHPEAPKYHYFAGLAREGAGDDTAAYVHMRHFLASDAEDTTERKRAKRRAATILARTTKVSLRTPTHTAPLTLRLTRTGAAHLNEPAIVIPLAALPTTHGAHELALTSGQWELALDPERLGEMEVPPRRVEVLEGVRTMTIELVARPVRHELTLDLGPARALKRGITLELHRSSGPSLSLTTRTPTVFRELPPGTWTYEARAPGFLPQKHTLELNGPRTLQVQLTPKWSDDRRKRLKLGLGLAGAGLATGLAGAALLGVSEVGMPKTVSGDLYSTQFDAIRPLRVMGDAGSAALGVTAGLWTSALTGSLTRHPETSWKTTLALGLLTTVGGVIGYGLIHQHWRELNESAGLDPVSRRYAPMLTSGGIGLGLGLISGAIATFAQHRPHRFSRSAALRHKTRPQNH